jgi:hypothetical protein
MTPEEIAREAIFQAKARRPKTGRVVFLAAQRLVGANEEAIGRTAQWLMELAAGDEDVPMGYESADEIEYAIEEMVVDVRFPPGQRLAHILSRAEDIPVMHDIDARTDLLRRCCIAMASPRDGTFYLSARDAGKLLKSSHQMAYWAIKRCIRYGYIRRTWTGHRGKANEYQLCYF